MTAGTESHVGPLLWLGHGWVAIAVAEAGGKFELIRVGHATSSKMHLLRWDGSFNNKVMGDSGT